MERGVMISVCLAGAILLLPLCWGHNDYDYDYNSTQNPEYDYNSTIGFSFYSNASGVDLEKYLMGGETGTEGETSITETETDVHAEKPTEATDIGNQASRSKPVCFHLTLVLMVHQLLRRL